MTWTRDLDAHCEHYFTVVPDIKTLDTITLRIGTDWLISVMWIFSFPPSIWIWFEIFIWTLLFNLFFGLNSCIFLLWTLHQLHHSFYLQLLNCDIVSLADLYSSLSFDLNSENTTTIKHCLCQCAHFVHCIIVASDMLHRLFWRYHCTVPVIVPDLALYILPAVRRLSHCIPLNYKLRTGDSSLSSNDTADSDNSGIPPFLHLSLNIKTSCWRKQVLFCAELVFSKLIG